MSRDPFPTEMPTDMPTVTPSADLPESSPVRSDWPGYGGAFGACALAALIGALLRPYFDLANIVMLFPLAVVIVAARWGKGPSILAAVLGVALFDFFFVPPHFSFAVSDAQYLLTFGVMLVVGLTTAHLTAGIRRQGAAAAERAEANRRLYRAAREMAATLSPEQVREIAERFVGEGFAAHTLLLLPGDGPELTPCPGSREPLSPVAARLAWSTYERQVWAELPTDPTHGGSVFFLPLVVSGRSRGVLVVRPGDPARVKAEEPRRQLETFATLLAITVERLHFEEVARRTLVGMESERLRNSLLSALSHDLRTPLTALLGLAESLRLTRPALSAEQDEIADAIRDEAARTTALVNNILDMARLQSGEVRLRRSWQAVEEMAGGALRARRTLLAGHRLQVLLPDDLPLVECDGVLIERVLVNLLENAAKYTPPGSLIMLSAKVEPGWLTVTVADDGPGLPPGPAETLFEKFTRGRPESATAGVGLGLAIAREVIAAHGGRIWAENLPEGGAAFRFTLPLSEPPAMEAEAGDPEAQP